MNTYCISLSLAGETPKTLLQLLQEAIAARTYPGAADMETQAINRLGSGSFREAFIRTDAETVYMMDAYKGVTNGVADTASPLVAGDFTAVPGGGKLLEASSDIYLSNGAPLGSLVLFKTDAGDGTVYLHASFQ